MAYQPTPYSIALATLISLHCEESSPLYSSTFAGTKEPNLDISKVDAFLQELFLNNDESSNARTLLLYATPVYKLVDRFSKCGVSETTVIAYKEWLQTTSQSIDSLTDLIATLKHSITDGSVDSSSSNGIFIRSICLGFDDLSFESTIKLWKDYLQETRLEPLMAENEVELGQQWTLSSEQLENSVRNICVQFSRGQRVDTSQVLQQMKMLVYHDPEMPSFHFLQFLLCLENGERVGAIDALHKYVDYVLIRSDNLLNNANTDENGSIRRNEEILQFAAILKTFLHMNFGDEEVAMSATEEAVKVAQQSQDPECVAFALGWLSLNAKDSGTASQLMQQCIQRATESNLRSLVAGGNLTSAARPDLLASQQSRGARQPESDWLPWSNAMASDLSVNTDIDSCRWDCPVSIAHFPSEDRVLSTLGQQRLVAAGIWDRFGYTSQSSLYSFLALHECGSQLSRDDINVAIQNMARRCLSGSSFASPIPLTKHAYETGDFSGVYGEDSKENCQQDTEAECVYGSSILHMMQLRNVYGLQQNGFDMEMALFIHEWAVRRGELRQANALCCAMESHLHPRLKNNFDISFDVYLQKAMLLTRQGNFDEAKIIVDEQLQLAKSSNASCRSLLVARCLIQLTLINLESCNSEEFVLILDPLMTCISITRENRLDGLYAIAQSLLAQVYLINEDYVRASTLIRAVLPSLLQLEHVWFQAEAYLTLGKIVLAKGNNINMETGTATEKRLNVNMKNALTVIKRSEELFRSCQDYIRLREVYYLLARVHNAIPGNTKERDEASILFLKISDQIDCEETDGNDCLIAQMANPTKLKLLAKRNIAI